MGEAWAATKLWRHAAANGCCGLNKKFSAQLGIGRFSKASAAMVAFDHTQALVLTLTLPLTPTLTLTLTLNPTLTFDYHAQELIAHVINSAKDNQWRAHYAATARVPARARGGLISRKRVRNLHSGVAPCFVHVPGVHESQRHEMMFRADARAAP